MLRHVLVVLALVIAPSAALADDTGAEGTIRALELNTSSADTYLQYHGRVVVAGKRSAQEYRWGGMSCGTRMVTEGQVAILQRAMEMRMAVQPRYQVGPGQHLCLVGFNLVD